MIDSVETQITLTSWMQKGISAYELQTTIPFLSLLKTPYFDKIDTKNWPYHFLLLHKQVDGLCSCQLANFYLK